ncbi:MAG: hypothetical protein LBB25_03925 [Holosporaceae bacterium]|jgi:uncharacterized protein YbaR (Trm112 family)|nr:hypothetical protein [Holosporaceae bacterium]
MKETPLISEDLLKILVCPKSGGSLKLESDRLVCKESSTYYAIQDGIPFVLDESP